MKRLLIAGGAGFIGSNFVRYMLDKHPDYEVVVYDKLTYAGRLENLQDVADDPRYSFVQGDICDIKAVEQVVREHRIDAIVNFAAESHVDRSIMEPGSFIQTDVYGTYVLLEAARKFGVERMVQVSTDEVYGSIEHGSFKETDPLNPSSPYSASKAGGDLMARAYYKTFGVPVVITRGSNSILEGEKVIAFDGCRFIYEKIEEVFSQYVNSPSQLFVPAFDFKTNRIGLYQISAIIREYVHKDAYLIKTKYGKTIRVTGDHSLFKRDANGLPVATPARELRVGDYIATLGILPAVELFSDELHIGKEFQRYPEVGYDFLVVSDETSDLILSKAEDIRELIYDEEHYQGYRGPRSSVYFWTTRQWRDYNAVPLAIYNKLGAELPHDAKLRPRFSSLCIPIKVKLDEDLLWLCGFFLAEGHLHYDDEHKDYYLRLDSEEALLRKALKIIETHFSLNPSYSPPTVGRSPSIIVRSKPLTYLFLKVLELGGLSGERRVPGWVFALPLEKLKHFIKGYYEGDALHHGKSRVKRRLFYAATSSRRLAEDLVLLLLRFGIIASLQGPYRNSARKGGEKKHIHYKVIAYGLDSLDPLDWSANQSQNLQTYKTNDIIWARVKEIKRLEYEGHVYDFSVPGVENFAANMGILCHNTFGPYQYPEKIIPLFITNAIDGLPLPLYGDGLNVRDWIYVLDHCEAIDLVLHKGTPGEIYNVGAGNELTNLELTKRILKLLGKPESLIQYVRDRPGHDRRYSLNCDKIKSLGWRCRYTFDKALEKTVEWYVENEWWWRKIKSGEYWEYYRRQYEGREVSR